MEREPELITIIEGPTPDFYPAPIVHRWMQSVYEGPLDQDVVICELRTATGADIVERCEDAWAEGRLVQLEYPDRMRMPQRSDVVAMRLQETEMGQLLRLWISSPLNLEEEVDEGDDDFSFG